MANFQDDLFLALTAALHAGESIMEIYSSEDYGMRFKDDRTPVTDADLAAHRIISGLLPEAGYPVLSEEGKEISLQERKQWERFWLVDPLDGTKEFISGNGEFSVNIALVEKRKSILGVLYSPVADLMYFAAPGVGAFRCTEFSSSLRECARLSDLLPKSESLPLRRDNNIYRVVASRSHNNPETSNFIRSQRNRHPGFEIVSKGSALKFGLLAEGSADVYPRFGPTWEWDTAAGHAIAEASGCRVYRAEDGGELDYNKDSLLNPHFIVERIS